MKTPARLKSTLLFGTLSTLTTATLLAALDSPNKPDESTLALFHFDESGTKAVDSGPKGHQLALGNESSRSADAPQWMGEPAGRYLAPKGDSTSGTSGVVENLEISGIEFGKGLTLSLWFRSRPDEPQAGELFQLEQPRVRVTVDDYGAGSNGRIRLIAPGTTPEEKPVIADVGAESRWRHVAVVYKPADATASAGGSWSMYLDGREIGSIADSNNLSGDTDILLRIGGNIWNNGPLQGLDIDEFLVSNKAITDFTPPAK